MNHVMIDLETLGTNPNAVILSIGAVKFNLESGEIDDDGFYASVSIDSNFDAGRKATENTIIWWMTNPEAAAGRGVFTEPKQPLEAALSSLSEWMDHDKRITWANGPEFDLAILADAYASFGWETPWKFWNAESMRTYKRLPIAKSVPLPVNDHHALRDAVNQARYVQAVYAAMVGTGKRAPTASRAKERA